MLAKPCNESRLIDQDPAANLHYRSIKAICRSIEQHPAQACARKRWIFLCELINSGNLRKVSHIRLRKGKEVISSAGRGHNARYVPPVTNPAYIKRGQLRGI